ncbi:hypothetical protein B8W99_08050 [Peribacillus simplex]|nr:hypothetical protein B8W99_08050 [Peribacillus simplex]
MIFIFFYVYRCGELFPHKKRLHSSLQFLEKRGSKFQNKVDWNVRYETPAGKNVSRGDPTGAKAPRRLPGPPAESECLEWKSTFKMHKPK